MPSQLVWMQYTGNPRSGLQGARISALGTTREHLEGLSLWLLPMC